MDTTVPTDTCGSADATRFGLRTACWLRVLHPTVAVRACFEALPSTRVVRHGDYVHVLYDVDGWITAGAITREDVVARLRSALFAREVTHDVALGHFLCETGSGAHDGAEIARALRTT